MIMMINYHSPGMGHKMHCFECVRTLTTKNTCSKEAVVHYIEDFYKKDRFAEITEKVVMDIKSSIMSGSYHFHHLGLLVYEIIIDLVNLCHSLNSKVTKMNERSKKIVFVLYQQILG